MGLITRQTPTLFGGTEVEGIIGMGSSGRGQMGGPSWFSQLVTANTIRPVFSFFTPPKYIGTDSQLTIGGTDPSKFTGSINYVPAAGGNAYWNISFQGITVNGQRSPIRGTWAIADSGTSNMVAPPADARAIYAMISPKIKLIDQRGAYGMACSDFEGLNASITFTMKGQPYTIPSKELNVGPYPGQEGICQGLINSPREVPFWIIGGSLLKYYYTVWDTGNKQLGFARAAHSPPL